MSLAQKLNQERLPTRPEKMILISLAECVGNPRIEPLAAKTHVVG